jgi:hypothetical protein
VPKKNTTPEEIARSAALAKERRRRYADNPETAKKRAEYYRRPEVQQRYKERANTERQKEYMRQWRQSDVGKACTRAASLKNSTEGTFSLDLWAKLAEFQGNACAICRRPFDSLGYRDVHADHCHEELKPRGLLCRNCNHAEGQIRKTGLSLEDFCRRMSAYLGSPPAQQVTVTGSTPEKEDSNVA